MVSISEVLDLSNLYAAWEKVHKNQGVGGIDGVSQDDFKSDLTLNLETLRNEVRHDSYRPFPLLRVEIDKDNGRGKRPLSIPTIRDRVLQTAVTRVITPVFEAEFEEISFAYRQGRSVGQAISQVEWLREQGYHWVVDADIHRFFDEVDHELLMTSVEKLITDTAILKLIRLWLKVTIVDGKNHFQLDKGIPQGSPISPLLANLFLDHLDDISLDNNLRLIRYADDFLVLCKTADHAQEALELTGEVLEQLKLRFSEHKTRVVDFNQGFHFLGVQFIRSLAIPSKNNSQKTSIYPADITDKNNDNSSQLIDHTSQHQTKQAEVKPAPQWFNYTLADKQQYESSDEMQEAFSEAGISPEMFPSEDKPDDHIEPPVSDFGDESSESNEPRLKTLYLLEHGSVLGKQYERFIIRKNGEVVKEIPAIHVDQIMVFGNSQLTTQVMQFCLEQRIPIYLLSGKGRFYGMVDSFDTEPVLLHREQFRRAEEPDFCLELSKQILRGKISNSRLLLKRLSRHRDAPALSQAGDELSSSLSKLETATNLDQLRGYEGNAAKIYFQSIAATVDESWGFKRRVKNPPTDPINAMLSYGYTLLYYNVYTFLRVRGLNPHVGYLHPLRMGHPALASDMVEEFRALVVDAVVLKMVLSDKLSPDDFQMPDEPGGMCLLLPKIRNRFIRQLENKLNAAIQHPVSHFNHDYRRSIEHQVNHLAAVIRQREPSYQPWVLR